MKRWRNPVLILVVLGVVGGLYWRNKDSDPGQDVRVVEMDSWIPTISDIKSQMTPLLPGQDPNDLSRKREFCNLLKKQFRSHQLAVGFKLNRKNQVTILVEPHLEPWIVDKIAVLADQATVQQFGGVYDVKVFETYIGTSSALVAEGTHLPQNPKQLVMKHHAPLQGKRI